MHSSTDRRRQDWILVRSNPELIEMVIFEDIDSTMAILHRLRDLGVGIAMETSTRVYSSPNYPECLPCGRQA
jgi:EAL domain-containing protein (putative c-di-GMP-specific phosphodiesterase class I)